ncbi:MAG: transpeptidase family protein [Alphaproteobacteria bacterium]|nr:transpeptidase family protein [Alphaproteobacteria bacterium]
MKRVLPDRRRAVRAEPPQPEALSVVLDRARYRAAVVMVGVVLGYIVLALRAVPLMLMPDDRLRDKAASQFQQAIQVEAPRGNIFARDGALLASTVEMPSLHADPAKMAEHGIDATTLARQVAALVGEADEVDTLIERLSNPRRRDVVLAQMISPDLVPRLRELAPAEVLWTRDEPTRFYPSRSLGAQVLGVVGSNGRGLEGVERYLDRSLRGSTYRFVQQRDRRGRAISTAVEARNRAQAGDAVTLTLDPYIQRAAEDALDGVVERSKPLATTVIVVDVKTGEILALANRPTTNPNDRYGREIANLRNHAVADAYEPGSVLKPFIVALALEEGLVKPDSPIDCEGGRWKVGRSIINDDHPHGVVTVSEVVKYSSNIGVAKMAFDLGAERVMDGLRRFGFAQRTEVDLPSEVGGFLRSPKRIRPIELATTAFGQGMTATPIQLAAAVASLANRGARMQPYVVSEVRDRHDFVKVRNRPRLVEHAVSPEAADAVVAMMATVLEEGGTGTRARIPGYTAAGKTGTAQKVVDGRYSPTARVSSFIGLAPAHDPRIAIIVQTDTPTEGSRYGGTVSGPVFSSVGAKALRYLGVAPDALDEDDEPLDPDEDDDALVAVASPELTWTEDGQLRVPDLTGLSMRDLLVTVDGAGLELALVGSGQVVSHSPAAGQALSPGDRLEVLLR